MLFLIVTPRIGALENKKEERKTRRQKNAFSRVRIRAKLQKKRIRQELEKHHLRGKRK